MTVFVKQCPTGSTLVPASAMYRTMRYRVTWVGQRQRNSCSVREYLQTKQTQVDQPHSNQHGCVDERTAETMLITSDGNTQ